MWRRLSDQKKFKSKIILEVLLSAIILNFDCTVILQITLLESSKGWILLNPLQFRRRGLQLPS